MPDEPTLGEALRRLDETRADMRSLFAQLNSRLDTLVSSDAFLAEQRRVDERIKDLADDIAAEREQRAAGDTAQQKTIDKLTANIRWVAAAIVLPIALFLASIVMSAQGGAG